MRILAAILNVAFLLWLTVRMADVGIPESGSDQLFIALAFLVPVVNMVPLFYSGVDLVTTWLKRKNLEEKSKIRGIEERQERK
jgi:hypothetical protein